MGTSVTLNREGVVLASVTRQQKVAMESPTSTCVSLRLLVSPCVSLRLLASHGAAFLFYSHGDGGHQEYTDLFVPTSGLATMACSKAYLGHEIK